ncbi:MAG: hypothetical protein H7144_14765 [Burkholderiales bacterium]|nr:hypothetical protein [Phycisphaerae bacterium]
MPEQTLMSRVRDWFRGPAGEETALPDLQLSNTHHPEADGRASLFRPFAKRDAALQSLQAGFVTLTDLMVGIRENLESQGKRQHELLEHLARLPAVLEQLPESARVQGETLKALHQQLSSQNEQQLRLTEILDHVSKSSTTQKDVLEDIQERVDRMRQTDEQIANNLVNVGTTMQELGRSTNTGAQILENMRDNITSRDNELQQVLLKQGTRFTVMLSIAIFLSIAALVAVSVIGYLMLIRPR